MNVNLELENVTKDFGGVHAVKNVSFSLEQGRVLGLIGPNGSGKTTLLNIIAGTTRPSSGRVVHNGSDVTRLLPHRRVAGGIARTFQSTRLLADWTLRDTMELGRRARPSARSTADIAKIVGLTGELDRLTGSLPSAIQRMAMVAVALSASPSLLLLDEPAVGMDIHEADQLHAVIRAASTQLDATVIVVEHNMRFLMSLADTIVVMASGAVLAEGDPASVRADPAVITAYLGD